MLHARHKHPFPSHTHLTKLAALSSVSLSLTTSLPLSLSLSLSRLLALRHSTIATQSNTSRESVCNNSLLSFLSLTPSLLLLCDTASTSYRQILPERVRSIMHSAPVVSQVKESDDYSRALSAGVGSFLGTLFHHLEHFVLFLHKRLYRAIHTITSADTPSTDTSTWHQSCI